MRWQSIIIPMSPLKSIVLPFIKAPLILSRLGWFLTACTALIYITNGYVKASTYASIEGKSLSAIQQSTELHISPSQDLYHLNSHTFYWYENKASHEGMAATQLLDQSLEQVWHKLGDRGHVKNTFDKSTWYAINFTTSSQLSNNSQWVFVPNAPFADYLDLYVFENNKKIKSSRQGIFRDRTDMKFLDKDQISNLILNPNSNYLILIHQYNTGANHLSPKLMEKETFNHIRIKENLLYGFFGGFIFLLISYNVILYFATNINLYLIYNAFLVVSTITTASWLGFFQMWDWSNNSHFTNFFSQFGILICLAIFSYFLFKFLNLRLFRDWLSWLLIFIIVIFITGSYLYSIGDYNNYGWLYYTLAPVMIFTFSFMGFVGAYQKRTGAIWVGLGWLIYFFGIGIANIMIAYAPALSSVSRGGATVVTMILEILCISIGMAMHISLIRKNEIIAMQKKSSTDRFMAHVGHELRTPLNSIIGLSELLLNEKKPDDNDTGYINNIYQSGNILLDLINDLLDFSKIEAGKLTIETIEFKFTTLFDDIHALFDKVSSDKGLEFIFDISDEISDHITSDPTRIRQILVNFLSNSFKFTKHGSIKLKVFIINNDTPQLRFEVKDTGAGIPIDYMSVIFSEFEQAFSSSARKHGGTGLGLNICKKLAELMGGGVGVNSEEGKGAMFWLELPYLPTDTIIESRDTMPTSSPSSRPLNILVAEDNTFNQFVINALIEKLDHTVTIVENGQLAVDLFKKNENHFDCVLMDCEMPIMDGYEASKEIRCWEKENQLRETPIHALTAHAFEQQLQTCLDAGMNGRLSKPIKQKELIELFSSINEGPN